MLGQQYEAANDALPPSCGSAMLKGDRQEITPKGLGTSTRTSEVDFKKKANSG